MANICEVNGIVKGNKNACYAFIGSMRWYDEPEIVHESGKPEDFYIHFNGECKWCVDAYCDAQWLGNSIPALPNDPQEAYCFGAENYSNYTIQDLSKIFSVEVLCYSSLDLYDEFPLFEHYKCGKFVEGDCPSILLIDDCEVWTARCNPDTFNETHIGNYQGNAQGIFADQYRENFPYVIFNVMFSNALLKELMEEYNYSSEFLDGDLFSIEDPDPDDFVCYGLDTLEHLNRTLLSMVVAFGEYEDGFEEALVAYEQEFWAVYNEADFIGGTFAVLTDAEAELCSGAYFEYGNDTEFLKYNYRVRPQSYWEYYES